MNHYQYIDWNGNKYIVKRKFKYSVLKENFDQELMKQWTMSDTLLRKDGILYCCERIEDALYC